MLIDEKWRAENHILVEDESCETIADFFVDDSKSQERCKLAAGALVMYKVLLLYIDDCEIEKLEYNDDTYDLARRIVDQIEN